MVSFEGGGLAAQWALETGFGHSCHSNNFGNVKATSDKVGHMYLRGIWEFPSPRTMEAAEKMVAASGGMAELADAKFKASKGYPADAPIVVFKPPHPQTRFIAFKTADEGMAAYVRFKQNIAAKNPDYVAALNRGDVHGVAAVLAKVRYASAPDAAYAAGMDARLDLALLLRRVRRRRVDLEAVEPPRVRRVVRSAVLGLRLRMPPTPGVSEVGS